MICPISVVVTARDEQELLPGALASVAGWAEEIVVVVDPRTRDRTREVAATAGARVLEHPFESSAAQCNWGLDRCSRPWALVLDADERVSARLREAVARELAAPRSSAYEVRRANFAFGHHLRFGDWGRDFLVRVLHRYQARFVERAVHGAVEAPSVGRLRGEIEHHTLRSLAQYLPKLDDYALRGAADLAAAGRRARLWHVLVHAEWRFVRGYLLRLGCLDGSAGFLVAVLLAYGTFLKWAAAWEAQATKGRPRP